MLFLDLSVFLRQDPRRFVRGQLKMARKLPVQQVKYIPILNAGLFVPRLFPLTISFARATETRLRKRDFFAVKVKNI